MQGRVVRAIRFKKMSSSAALTGDAAGQDSIETSDTYVIKAVAASKPEARASIRSPCARNGISMPPSPWASANACCAVHSLPRTTRRGIEWRSLTTKRDPLPRCR